MAHGPRHVPGHIRDEMLAEAATVYSLNGSIKDTAKHFGVDDTTVSKWQAHPVFQAAFQAASTERSTQLKAKLAKIVEDGYEALHQRILSGDVKLVKVGDDYETRVVPMTGKDVAIATSIAFDKLALASGRTPQQTSEDRLQALADKLERLAAPPVTIEVPKEGC